FERGVTCMLFHLGSSGGYSERAQAMGVSKAWCIVQPNALDSLLNLVNTGFVRLSMTLSEWDSIAEGVYKKRGFPFCGGVISRTLIDIICPEGFFFFQYTIMSFDIRSGSWSDNKIFMHSKLGRKIDLMLPRG
ncbi:hypothetical protein GN958_ATG04297, partial [Phytophthora infestans]